MASEVVATLRNLSRHFRNAVVPNADVDADVDGARLVVSPLNSPTVLRSVVPFDNLALDRVLIILPWRIFVKKCCCCFV